MLCQKFLGVSARVQHSGDMQKPSSIGSDQLRRVVTDQLLVGTQDQVGVVLKSPYLSILWSFMCADAQTLSKTGEFLVRISDTRQLNKFCRII